MLQSSLVEERDQVETLTQKVDSMVAEFKKMHRNSSPDAIKLKKLMIQYDEYEKSMIEQMSQKEDLIAQTNLSLNQSITFNVAKNDLIKARVQIEHLKQENATLTGKAQLSALKEELDQSNEQYTNMKNKWRQTVFFFHLGTKLVENND